jgi:cytochrome c oxidase assembly protein subunit 15
MTAPFDLGNPPAGRRRAIRIWLYAVAALVVLMVVVGGATRLTDSGLSIVEWRPVTGTLPPLSEADWLAEFQKYQTSSEYQLVNKGMSLTAFKRIFWWEWGHRLLGRTIGLAFLLPLLIFLYRGWIEPRLKWRLWIIFALGAMQGAVGWWMVASGLVGRVDVAQERLAIHLSMAALILIALVWTARSIDPTPSNMPPSRRLVHGATAILLLVLVQIGLGGLVAGLKAGLVYDTWPLIDGALIPDRARLFFLAPAWTNFVDNHLTVQFTHRMVAYLLVGLAVLHSVDCARDPSGRYGAGGAALAGVLLLQAVLGIATLLWNVPILLALAHQLVAMLALIVATSHAHKLVGARAGQRSSDRILGSTEPRHWLAPKPCSTISPSARTSQSGTPAPRPMRSR